MNAPTAAAPSAQVTEKEARAVAEAARETEWSKPSFVRDLFLGRLRMELLDPFPQGDPEQEARGREFLERLEAYLRTVDAAAIEREGHAPPEVLRELAGLGAFGIKIPREHGGLGLSQRTYGRAMALAGSCSPALGTILSAHQSIGVPQPLKTFGTPEQKAKYLPLLARGAVSAFALTESDVGSDPARMGSTAVPTEDGEAYVLDGEKLWCTNGPIAEFLVVMARTPPRREGGRAGITAFIVETAWEGVEVTHRCEFMGLRGIENGVVRFTGVRVPKENVLWGEGKGLKLALVTLNTGRLTLPATCAATGKWCLKVAREWAAVRRQWGAPIGKHEAVAQMLAKLAADTFAMEAVAELCAALADDGKLDIRLEAALAKLFNSEVGWKVVDDTMQIRGGRGYETAESLAARGEAPIAVEKAMRGMRINRIFEGSSEIMRLFIAREAVDPHLQKAGAFVDREAPAGARARAAVGLGMHMAAWYGGNLAGAVGGSRYAEYGELAGHVRFAARASRRLARTLAQAMARFGPKLERKQAVLFRLVDVGAELFAISAACVYARHLAGTTPHDRSAVELADLFCRGARRRVEQLFSQVFDNDDPYTYQVAQEVLGGRHAWLEEGVIQAPSPTPPA
ncbi:MAG TPA: acyl-CoA dehydrogenase family protein [Longimicrobiaceae bacterium]|nr:acyl-CoA dehydrogenase family protein [Longimicrobiaceae bacterium]